MTLPIKPAKGLPSHIAKRWKKQRKNIAKENAAWDDIEMDEEWDQPTPNAPPKPKKGKNAKTKSELELLLVPCVKSAKTSKKSKKVGGNKEGLKNRAEKKDVAEKGGEVKK